MDLKFRKRSILEFRRSNGLIDTLNSHFGGAYVNSDSVLGIPLCKCLKCSKEREGDEYDDFFEYRGKVDKVSLFETENDFVWIASCVKSIKVNRLCSEHQPATTVIRYGYVLFSNRLGSQKFANYPYRNNISSGMFYSYRQCISWQNQLFITGL